jgi:hypothetical protein
MSSMVKKFFTHFSPTRMKWIWRWIFLGILIGVVSGFGAILFNFLLQRGTQFFMKDLVALILPEQFREFSLFGIPLHRWMIIWIPALGGLLSGLIVFHFAPETEGHGTDAMVESFHRKKGIVRKRVPIVKTIASAITIGSGGSAGKEGPIAQIGSGFASFLASLLKMDERDRRVYRWKLNIWGRFGSTKQLKERDSEAFFSLLPVFINIFSEPYGWNECRFAIPTEPEPVSAFPPPKSCRHGKNGNPEKPPC